MLNNCFDQLLFVWQNPINKFRHVVGRLWYQNRKFYFAYDTEEAENLLKMGYRLHPAFPERNKVYESEELFSAFTSRLPDRRRNDYKKITQRYRLPDNCSEYELLKASAGKLATDNFEFAPAITPEKDGTIDIEFFVAGLRYYDGLNKLESVFVGKELTFELEPDNTFDKNAIIIRHPNGFKLGYVPAFYTECLAECINRGALTKVWITGIYPEAKPSEILKVRFQSKNCIAMM